MLRLIDKLSLFILTTILYVSFYWHDLNILFIIVSLIFSCLLSYFETSKLRDLINISFLLLSICSSDFIFFIPLIIYDFCVRKDIYYTSIYLLPLFIHFHEIGVQKSIFILFLSVLTYLLRWKSEKIIHLYETNKKIKDDSEELKILQELKQKELLERQDYEIQLAKAEERNRIAREIHDSVGHNLSSSLLQIGAMITINHDEKLKQPLLDMKETLDNAMNNIRNSVHDLHEDTLNLEIEMNKIIQPFSFCNVNFTYSSTNMMDMKMKYCFINILKEALNNIMKHSNATLVNINFLESNHFYQFIIHDNGTQIQIKDGMGLNNMNERVLSYHGICHISDENGFKIFINIPKEVS
ncbi:MAG: sensor histidine kinase [Erysipelotrichia bacterium]|nr:sensor histidine kinase [Erysipelotrichia bacterium]NCC54506.1 sensor histidine kinase [Erysipelotrichia bacterium]